MTEKEKADAMTPEERAAYILSIQSPSTRAALSRPVEDDIAWFRREIPKSAQCKDEQGNVFINERPIGYEESRVQAKLRYQRGEYIAQMRGEAPVTSVDEAKRNRAVDAFMFIKKHFKDLMKSWGLASDKEMARLKDDK